MAPRRPIQMLPAGAVLGEYAVTECLGRGAEGEVYRVVERRTGIDRALKLYHLERDPYGRHLRHFARKLTRLRSVPIVSAYHHITSAALDGRRITFLVSDYVALEPLPVFLRRQPQRRLSAFEALHAALPLVAGIAQVHDLGEYHGDLQAENVLIHRRGLGFEVRLLDFMDLGRPTKERIRDDVVDLLHLLILMLGGQEHVTRRLPAIAGLACGMKRTPIHRRFRHAGDLREALNRLDW